MNLYPNNYDAFREAEAALRVQPDAQLALIHDALADQWAIMDLNSVDDVLDVATTSHFYALCRIDYQGLRAALLHSEPNVVQSQLRGLSLQIRPSAKNCTLIDLILPVLPGDTLNHEPQPEDPEQCHSDADHSAKPSSPPTPPSNTTATNSSASPETNAANTTHSTAPQK